MLVRCGLFRTCVQARPIVLCEFLRYRRNLCESKTRTLAMLVCLPPWCEVVRTRLMLVGDSVLAVWSVQTRWSRNTVGLR